uniref:Uncharacterized protein n=1 Tax=Anguilla anguilla TaxID=7936 RepID=A0A0E9XMA2_ANGAN
MNLYVCQNKPFLLLHSLQFPDHFKVGGSESSLFVNHKHFSEVNISTKCF